MKYTGVVSLFLGMSTWAGCPCGDRGELSLQGQGTDPESVPVASLRAQQGGQSQGETLLPRDLIWTIAPGCLWVNGEKWVSQESDPSSPDTAVRGELLSEIACFYWLPEELRDSVSEWNIILGEKVRERSWPGFYQSQPAPGATFPMALQYPGHITPYLKAPGKKWES